jgi:hypothetical protein
VGYIVAFIKVFYNVSNISYMNSSPQPFSFIPAPYPIPRVVSTGIIFAFACICMQLDITLFEVCTGTEGQNFQVDRMKKNERKSVYVI